MGGFRKLEVDWKVWFLLVGVLMMGFVLAVEWVGDDVDYHVSEDVNYYHNLSANISGFNSDITFEIDTQPINWTNVSGTFSVDAVDVAAWISITDSITGNLTINVTDDWQTGYFIIPIQANNASGPDVVTDFEFQINATNDVPNFSLSSDYNVSVPVSGNVSNNISLVGSDEEEHYPLVYNLSFLNCSFAAWSDRNSSNCNLSYAVVSESNTSSMLSFSNLTNNDVGIFNLTICVHDDVNAMPPPLYRDSDYDENKSYCQNTTLNLLASLEIDASNCTNVTVMEGEQFNCTINITTKGTSDSLNISSYAFFKNGGVYDSSNRDWFYASSVENASNNQYSVPISITPGKEEVGNWTVNFNTTDLTLGGSEGELIDIYVNFSEAVPVLDVISNVTLYENDSFSVNGVDTDLLIWDNSVKDEFLTFASNVSWVSVTSPVSNNGVNYSTSVVGIDYDYALANFGEGNLSVRINITDGVGNFSERIFVVEIQNESAPEWNASLDDPVVFNLTESSSFYYNVSTLVSDAENNVLTFYYENANVSVSFCSLTPSNFISSGVSAGVIDFVPKDCDVGFHNVTIIAGDGFLNSSYSFVFNVSNVADAPSISTFTGNNGSQEDLDEGFSLIVQEDNDVNFSLFIDDDDFLIPSGQRSVYYNEYLDVDVVVTNSTGSEVELFEFSFVEFGNPLDESVHYNSSFAPDASHVGDYTIFVNISDVNGNFTNRTFYLNVTDSNDAPNLSFVSNQSLTLNEVLNLDINAIDEESGNESSGNLSYSLDFLNGSDFVNGSEMIFNSTTGVFNLSLNSSYVGEYRINVTVNDSGSPVGEDWQVFYVFVYGVPNVTSPLDGYVFNWTEDVAISDLNFSMDYGINNTNLSYEFSMDKIVYFWVNQSNGTKGYNYTNLTSRVNGSFVWNSSVNLSFDYTPTYEDESYGMLKNFSLLVWNADYPELNYTMNYSINVSHTNENISFIPVINKKGPVTKGTIIPVNLSSYFSDADYFDVYYNQNVNFSLETYGEGGYVVLGSFFSGWILNLGSSTAVLETVMINAYEWDDSNISLGNVTSNTFDVEFTEPTVTTTTTSRTRTRLEFFSLRIIVPQEVIIDDDSYIDVPFSLENAGVVDLSGINLSTQVLFNNEFSDDIRIELEDDFVPFLKIGESIEYVMRIFADTTKSGRYKATVFANVTSPKFSDWGDFFIDLRKTNETEAEQLLIFTEKLLADNPECLELTELFVQAQDAFDSGDVITAMNIAKEVSEACEDYIVANEQIRYNVEGFVRSNLYYISFATIVMLFVGFIFYVYKRVRFNKSGEDEYIMAEKVIGREKGGVNEKEGE